MSDKTKIVNEQNGVSVNIKSGGHCKSTGIVYAIKCKKCQEIYVGESGKTASTRYSGHKYDINNRPDNCDFAKHCARTPHVLDEDLEFFIIEHGIHDESARKRAEDKYICKLQTLKGTGINCDLGSYAKEMYTSWTSCVTS